MKYIFIANPVAGINSKVMKYIPKVQKYCQKQNLEYAIHISESGSEIRKFVKEVCSKEEEIRIYAMGGDGTLSHVINGAVGYKNVEVGVLPLGTGNDFVKNFPNGETDYLDIEKQIAATSEAIDLIRFKEEYCVNMLNMGLDARVGMDMPKFKKIPFVNNKMAYNLSLVYHLLGKLGRYMEVYGDDELLYKGEIALCCLSNGISCGGGFSLTPSAKVNDGLLDIAYVKVPKKILLPKILNHVKEGTQFEKLPTKDYMKTVSCKKARIITREEMPLVNDGETDIILDCTFEVVEQAINFIQPK